MKLFRKILFWCHLIAGVTAGLIVFLMSVTGVLLTYEKQMISRADKNEYNVAAASANAAPLSPEALLAQVSASGATPTSLTIRADQAAPASVTVPNVNGRGDRTIFINPFTGAQLGEGAQGIRHFFRTMEDWHRWIGREGASRSTGKSINDICNLLFLFIVVSGLYLWFPRAFTFTQFKQILWFKRGMSSKARDFNWHNVIGFWCCVPLFIVVMAGVVISYPWASNLVYRAAGEAPPNAPPRPPEPPPNAQNAASTPVVASLAGLDKLMLRAKDDRSDWRTINVRLPKDATSPFAFAIDAGTGGQPYLRHTLTLNRAGEVVKREHFTDGTKGRQWRTILRFAHTGEVLGWFGQTLAGIASLGACFLVYTGWALTWRRFRAWQGRRAKAVAAAEV